jgi:hypothetical protein
MSIWGKKGRHTPTIRIEKIAEPSPPASLKKSTSQIRTQSQPFQSRRAALTAPKQSKSRDSTSLLPKKRPESRKRSPAIQRIESDSDDDGSIIAFDTVTSKKAKTVSNVTVDVRREVGALLAFSSKDEKILIHAADIACVKHKFPPVFDALSTEVAVQLQYPGSIQRERYVKSSALQAPRL